MRTRREGLLGALGAFVACAVACSVGDLPADQPGKGGTSAGGSATGGAAGADAGGQGGSGGSQDGGPCADLYVSPQGDDANSGCDGTHPKKTIGSALDTAHASSSVASIRICAGTYDEALTLDIPVNLLGGWDCVKWSRTSSYGAPSFDGVNETVVGGTQTTEALRVTGSSVAASTTVDGLTLNGGVSPVTLRIESAAAPVVSNCKVQGGTATSATADGSVGIRVESGAAPEIRDDRIEGGVGSTDSAARVGRVGIAIDAALPYVHDSVITGGSSAPVVSSGCGSVGILIEGDAVLTEATGRPILRNDIRGGDGYANSDGVGPAGTLLGSAGVLIRGTADVDVVEDSIRADHTVGGAYRLRGIDSETTGALRVVRSRIYGGPLSDPNDPSKGERNGIWVSHASSFLAENDMIYGGVADGGPPAILNSPSYGMTVDNVANPVIRHCTIYSGKSDFNWVATAIHLNGGVTGAVIQNDILAADAHWNIPMLSELCATLGVFAKVENNLLFNTGDGSNDHIKAVFSYMPNTGDLTNCGSWQGFETIDEMTNHLLAKGVPSVSGNLTLKQDCGTDSGCIVWPTCQTSPPDSAACLSSVFTEWSSADNGLSTLFGTGWKLLPSVPCAIAKSSLDVGTGVDLFGTPRTSPPSMGAFELDSACVP